jgi:hypothetical protein
VREAQLRTFDQLSGLYYIFDKLGISSSVELVLYAVSHGGHREGEWVAGGGI